MPRRKTVYFINYFENWIDVYKKGAVSQITLEKYYLALKHLTKIAPDVTLNNITRLDYQSILNKFAETHERNTTMDFHHETQHQIFLLHFLQILVEL